ncbi:MAG: hypothetical protein ABR910_00710 [Acidobacteriaceae bacterium]|jgi:hypothetical protein
MSTDSPGWKRAADQSAPGREAGVAEGRRSHIVDRFRQRDGAAGRGEAPLGHRAKGSGRAKKVHAGAIGQRADAVVARHKRELAAAAVVRAAGLSLHQIAERRGMDPHQHCAVLGLWIGEGGVTRRLVEGFDDGGVHSRWLL